MSAQSVYCPTCDAEPGAPCVVDGRAIPTPHPDRLVAARTESFARHTRPVSRWRGRPLPEPTGRWAKSRDDEEKR